MVMSCACFGGKAFLHTHTISVALLTKQQYQLRGLPQLIIDPITLLCREDALRVMPQTQVSSLLIFLFILFSINNPVVYVATEQHLS